ncbi:hypothetical protein SPACI_022120 [Sporomusa acidovorans DSM 3132]|uniref:Uncharacterized protein n=2 Tax=Sporomusa TaxID=2375 RepID=A0ABZ3J282_SPOA4|nr:hypothetical protein SPACI_01900 [Sporomusa acidovorans DSM 3132]SDF37429.1 hypothetical protein SAMN04488499_104619 [Sporomusa acidovorans]
MNWGMEMKKKLIGAFAVMVFTVFVYFWRCFVCIANANDVFSEDYARMSQEIVEQSLQN